ncbi:ceramide synthase 6-like isoform X2 [Mixophyes fleayi]|uniref:ceramide synthase 6-like isoform X2 n=1 Tax=Mixophyes fleayi TaxID=3061075 RepID=UPI003F4E0E10
MTSGSSRMSSLLDPPYLQDPGSSCLPNVSSWLHDHVISFFPAYSTSQTADVQEASRAKDLLIVLPLILFISLIRLICERTIFRFLAWWLKLEKRKPAPRHVILEKIYKTRRKKPSRHDIMCLAKKLSLHTSEVRTWFKQRLAQDKPSTERKFCESMWRFLFYTWAELYAWRYISKTNWILDGAECWRNTKSYVMSTEEYNHYMTEMAFYGSLVLSQFFDVKRKDFKVMFVHHIVTIFLLSGSYCHNMTRIGALTMLYHDISDVFLEAAKITNYIHQEDLCNALFLIFAVIFMMTRLILLPLKCAVPVLFHSEAALAGLGVWKYYVFLIILMQALHIYWSALICKMVMQFYKKGKVSKDDRSDVDSSSDDENNVSQDRKPRSRVHLQYCQPLAVPKEMQHT